jgi:hypothetical protein
MPTFVLLMCLPAPLLGATVGLVLWLVARRHFQRAGWWILAASVGWTAASVANIVVSHSVFGLSALITAGTINFLALTYAVIGGLVFGGVFGLITSPMFIWLMIRKADPVPPQ